MHKLDVKDFERTRPLLSDLAPYNVSIAGVLEGNNPGTVYVDNPIMPHVVLLIGPEGSFLAGSSPSAAQISALKDLITDLMEHQGFEALWLDCRPAWGSRLVDILPWPPLQQPRRHYVCTSLTLDWRSQVPEGFRVQSVTRELLDRAGLDIPDHLYDWMQNNWGSTDAFLARGFGFVTVDVTAERVVSWSLCDCIGDGVCEIGIHTRPEYRQRGFAAITVAAAVDHALANGFRAVGWHCHAENTASWRTALRVGFVWERDYVNHVCFRSEAVHWAEAGRLQAAQGNYQAAADIYIRADTAEDQPVWGAYIPFHAACMFAQMGDYPTAWHWLNRAAARGFDDVIRLQSSDALIPLRTTNAWATLIETITQATEKRST
ncbi:MAG: GNAT family N-acetyltransferase [Anaerolineae bacterium]|nr:GNAT family N-acetyltransferase [Anaerolineae bacterium]